MKKIRVLTISSTGLAKKEGISTVILDNYTLFDKDRFQLDVAAAGGYSFQLVSEFQKIGVNIRCLPSRKISVMKYIAALAKLMKKEKYDVIYLHGSSAILSIELIVSRICGCKKRIVHSHNTTCGHKIVDKLLRPVFYCNYTTALACGKDAGKWLYGSRPFEIIKNGRDVNKYSFNSQKRYEMRKALKLDDDTLAIGHVGNFNIQKNQRFLIQILERLLKREKKVKLFLMGDGNTREQITQLVADKGISGYVEFTGSVSNVPDMLQAMDLMLLPSLYEGLPLVAVEWQMMGLPCLLSDRITEECVFTDLIDFLSVEDEDEWVRKIIDHKKTPVNREEESLKAITAAEKCGYDLHANTQRLQSFFL